jgi:hypothetical protein
MLSHLARWVTVAAVLLSALPGAAGQAELPVGDDRGGEVFVRLQPPDLAEAAGAMRGPTLEALARDRLAEQAQPVLARLSALVEAGWVTTAKLDLDQGWVRVTLPRMENRLQVETALAAFSVVRAVTVIPPCPAGIADPLPSRWAAEARFAAAASEQPTDVTQATNPSIVFFWNQARTTWRLEGQAPANAELSWRILANGTERYRGLTRSGPSGAYAVNSSELDCAAFHLRSGDVVEVSAGGSTVQMPIAGGGISLDVAAETVRGVTLPGRDVAVTVRGVRRTATADGNGLFAVDFLGVLDLTGRDLAALTISDSNQNQTRFEVNGPRLELMGSVLTVYYRTWANYYIEQRRGSQILLAATGSMPLTGVLPLALSTQPQPGDVFRFRSGDTLLQMTALSGDVSLVAGAAVQLQGSAPAGVEWEASVQVVGAGCALPAAPILLTGNADASGQIRGSINATVFPGSRATVSLVDAGGNRQWLGDRYAARLVVAERTITGVWARPVTALQAVVRDGGGALRASVPVTPTGAAFFANVNSRPGDRIEVGDGTVTATVASKPTVTAALSPTSITGNAPNGPVRVTFHDFDVGAADLQATLTTTARCSEATAVGGAFAVPVGGVTGRDRAQAEVTTSEGHRILAASAIRPYSRVTIGSDEVSGYSGLSAGTGLTLALQQAGQSFSITTTVGVDGAYVGRFRLSGSSVYVAPGMTLTVTGPGGVIQTRPIGAFSLASDVAANRYIGLAGVNHTVEIRPVLESGGSLVVTTKAAASGVYVAALDGRVGNCQSARLNARCDGAWLTDYDFDGNTTWLQQRPSPPPAPDAWEPDNAPVEARDYAGPQARTFSLGVTPGGADSVLDSDHVRFTVRADQAGRAVGFRVAGARAAWVVYWADTLEPITALYPDGEGRVTWTPPAGGAYVLRLTGEAVCGAEYTLTIGDVTIANAALRLYLPLMTTLAHPAP